MHVRFLRGPGAPPHGNGDGNVALQTYWRFFDPSPDLHRARRPSQRTRVVAGSVVVVKLCVIGFGRVLRFGDHVELLIEEEVGSPWGTNGSTGRRRCIVMQLANRLGANLDGFTTCGTVLNHASFHRGAATMHCNTCDANRGLRTLSGFGDRVPWVDELVVRLPRPTAPSSCPGASSMLGEGIVPCRSTSAASRECWPRRMGVRHGIERGEAYRSSSISQCTDGRRGRARMGRARVRGSQVARSLSLSFRGFPPRFVAASHAAPHLHSCRLARCVCVCCLPPREGGRRWACVVLAILPGAAVGLHCLCASSFSSASSTRRARRDASHTRACWPASDHRIVRSAAVES